MQYVIEDYDEQGRSKMIATVDEYESWSGDPEEEEQETETETILE